MEIGKKADLAIINTKTPNVWPPHNPYSLIAFCMNDSNVKTTIIDGKTVMKDRQLLTVDYKEVMSEAKDIILNLMKSSDLKQYKDKLKFLK